MKITLFGATGKTGPYLISEALKRGMEVTVFAREKSKFTHPGVRMIKGALTDTAKVTEAIRGTDVVMSALGPTDKNHPKNLPITQAFKVITEVMRKEGVRRLIATSTGTASDPEDKFDFKIWLPAVMIKLLLRSSYDDMVSYPLVIRKSNLDWTMVRLAVLKDSPPKNSLHAGLYGKTKHTFTVSRADVVAFMFDQIGNNQWIQKAPGISAR